MVLRSREGLRREDSAQERKRIAIDDDIRPAFMDEDDERFARLLFRRTLLKYNDQMKLIEPVLSAVGSERLADVDACSISL